VRCLQIYAALSVSHTLNTIQINRKEQQIVANQSTIHHGEFFFIDDFPKIFSNDRERSQCPIDDPVPHMFSGAAFPLA
jgi:hypothetical protein